MVATRKGGAVVFDDGSVAQAVVPVDAATGTPVSGAGDASEATLADILTALEGVLSVQQAQLRRTQDAVSAASVTGVIMQGDTERTPVFLVIDTASSGDNTLLAAQGSGNKIRVHQLFLVASAAVTVRFESGAGGTALTGQMQFAANGGIVLPYSPSGYFETAANALLNLELSGAVSVDGGLLYTVVS